MSEVFSLSGSEITALTNVLQGGFAFVWFLLLFFANKVLPGIHPKIAIAAKYFSIAPLSLSIHRLYWNSALVLREPGDSHAWWGPEFSWILIAPVVLGILCALVGIHCIGLGHRKTKSLVALFAAMLLPWIAFWVWVA